MKATLKNLNQYLSTLSSDFELVKGNGYVYFAFKEDAPPSTAETPESIQVCYLNQMTLEEWKSHIMWNYREWVKNNLEAVIGK
jgi:hypothetical protein|tara:strand:- start:69 stop:317 length:249 start_codon:yes stop_codon:yes gene_type:complete